MCVDLKSFWSLGTLWTMPECFHVNQHLLQAILQYLTAFFYSNFVVQVNVVSWVQWNVKIYLSCIKYLKINHST